MMVDKTYLTGKAPPGGALSAFANQTLVPGAIDAAGAVESALARVASAARRNPLAALALALGAGFLAAVSTRRTAR